MQVATAEIRNSMELEIRNFHRKIAVPPKNPSAPQRIIVYSKRKMRSLILMVKRLQDHNSQETTIQIYC